MTISNQQVRVSYAGDGSSLQFPIPFPFYLDTDIAVLLGTAVQAAGYSITGGEDANGNPKTGTVVFASAPANGVTVQLILQVPLTQLVELVDGTSFPSSTLNQVNDRAIQALLRQGDRLGRTISAPDGDVMPNLTLPAASVRANTYITFDANGNLSVAQSVPAGSLSQASIGAFLWPLTAGEAAAGVVPVNFAIPPGWISRYGFNLISGVTDMSVSLQKAVDANKGGFVYVDSLCLAQGILLSGSTYNGTEIRCVGKGELLLAPCGPQPQHNFDTSLWGGIIVQNCDRVLLDLRWHGNRANQAARESIHCVILGGATNIYIPSLKCREIRGDALYIDCVTPSTGLGQNSQNIVIDYLWAYNSSDDGRNACSVISCAGLSIGELHSYQVGGVINVLQEPGGLDLEPNWPTNIIADVTVGTLNVVTAGGTGLAIQGISTSGNDANRDWSTQRVTIGTARIRHTASGAVFIRRAADVTVNADVVKTNTRNFAAYIDYADRVIAKITGRFCTNVVALGLSDWVYDSAITVYGYDYGAGGVGGIWSVGVGRTTVNGKLYNAVPSVNALGIQLGTNGGRTITQNYVVYSVDFPFDPNVNTAVYNGGGADQVTIGTGTILKGCTLTGWPFSNQVNFQIPSYACPGRNYGTGLSLTIPGGGTWAQFDEISLDQPSGLTVPRIKCVVGGAPGTWKSYGVMST